MALWLSSSSLGLYIIGCRGWGDGEDQHPKTLFFLSQSEYFHLTCLIVGDTASLFRSDPAPWRGPAEQRGQDAGALASFLTLGSGTGSHPFHPIAFQSSC